MGEGQSEGNHREENYDLLRAISCVTVVLLHVSAMYIGDNFRDIVKQRDLMLALCFRVISQVSVPCFVMLSGAFLLKKKENADYRNFYVKSGKKLGVPIVIFSILYVLFHYIENLLGNGLKGNEQIDMYGPLLDWLNGVPHATMWYMYMIVPLYMIVPFLVIIKFSISEKAWHILAIILAIYSILVAYTCSLSWILQFAQWIGYFVMGDVISECGRKRKDLIVSRFPYICIAAPYILLIVYWYIHSYRTMRFSGPSFFSPFTVIVSMVLFIGFAYIQVPDNMLIQMVSRHSFYIYLLHPFLCEVLMQMFGRILEWFPPAWLIPVYALCITAVCVFIKRNFDTVMKRTVYTRKA